MGRERALLLWIGLLATTIPSTEELIEEERGALPLLPPEPDPEVKARLSVGSAKKIKIAKKLMIRRAILFE